jgi:hypothetical protein
MRVLKRADKSVSIGRGVKIGLFFKQVARTAPAFLIDLGQLHDVVDCDLIASCLFVLAAIWLESRVAPSSFH